MATVLGNVIEFFGRLGVFDVVLPFLLVFTMMFAIFERTKVLGTEKEGASRKNLNAMASFVIGFLVIASTRLVEAVTSISSNIVLLVLLGVFFLLTIGAFYKEGQLGKNGLPEGWLRTFFIVLMLIGVIVIFLNALKTEAGETWLDVSINYLADYWDSTVVASIALIILVVAFMAYLTGEGKKKEAAKKEDE